MSRNFLQNISGRPTSKSTGTGLVTGKKKQLKLNFENKRSLNDEGRKYETEKKNEPTQSKNIISTKSTSKLEPKLSL
jgi:hypothetical protein